MDDNKKQEKLHDNIIKRALQASQMPASEFVSKLPRTNNEPEVVIKNGKSASQIIDEADESVDPIEMVRNMVIDIGAPVATGAAVGSVVGATKNKIKRGVSRKHANERIEELKNSPEYGKLKEKAKTDSKAEELVKYQDDLVAKNMTDDKNAELYFMMKNNKKAAKKAFEGGKKEYAEGLRTVINNSIREFEIGPRFAEDVAFYLKNTANLTDSQITKAIKSWYKENKNVKDMLKLIEAKDPNDTFGHSLRVAEIAGQLARKAGKSEAEVKRLVDAALLHDIGKVQVPLNVLYSKVNKFNLTPEARKTFDSWMNSHDIDGGNILISDAFAALIASKHHPGKDFDKMVEEVKDVITADIYDAFTSERAYHPRRLKEQALESEKGLKWNVDNGQITQEYIDLLKSLGSELKEYYPVESSLKDAYNTLRANGVKNMIYEDYLSKVPSLSSDAMKSAKFGAGNGILYSIINDIDNRFSTRKPNQDRGGVIPTDLPTTSEVIGEFSTSFKPRHEKVLEIKNWYEKGLFDDHIENMILGTNFNDYDQVNNLYKEWKEYLSKRH